MRNASRSIRIAAIAASVAATLSAGQAMAVESLYAGGSTFAAPVYVGNNYNRTTPAARLSTNAGNTAGSGMITSSITPGSFFDAYKNLYHNHASYCQTGSGFGKNSLNAQASAPASSACNDFSTSPLGLSAPTNSPDFIGTDSPYSSSDYNAFLGSSALATHTGIVQVPTFAGAIALAHGTDVSNVALNTAQVCKIYSGKVTKWQQLAGVTGATSDPIVIVYRSDSSGTSFAFTRFLAATCNGTANVPAGFVFTPSSTFNSAVPGGVTAVYGTRAIGASGNAGVVSTTIATAGAQGYADISEVLNEGAPYATVSGFDPAKFGQNSSGVPTPISIQLTNLATGKVLDGATLNDVPGSGDQATKNCVRVVNPAVKFNNTYPIAAVTYLAAYTTGNGTAAHVTALKNLFNLFYDHTHRPVLPTGNAYLDGIATFGTSAKATVNACIQP